MSEETKVCSKCGVEKPLTAEYFYKRDKGSIDGFRNNCIECHHKKSQQYHQQNIDKELERFKQYWSENKERCKVAKREYYVRNKEKVAERVKRYAVGNMEKVILRNQKRRTRKQQLPHTLTSEQWLEAQTYFSKRCAYCGEELPLTQDHFIPLGNGGGLVRGNIIPACASCNSRKKKSKFQEWYPKQDIYNKDREQKILSFISKTNGG